MIPAPGFHGGDGDRLAAALGLPPGQVLDLSASLNPFAPDVAALTAEHASRVRTYPDPTAATIALAVGLGVDPDRVLLTNGGAEAIALVAAHLGTGRIDDPDFSLYRRHLAHVSDDGPRWRSNPHNPTGSLAAPAEQAEVWDEAFYPLATGCWTRGDGTFRLGSLTKVFACPGLRIGYLITPDTATRDVLAARQPQWSVNALACALVPPLLERADLPIWSAAISSARKDLCVLLEAHRLAPDPSDGNYVLVRRAPGLRDHLGRHAILVRDTASFGIRDGVRIAVPAADDLDRLANALEGYR